MLCKPSKNHIQTQHTGLWYLYPGTFSSPVIVQNQLYSATFTEITVLTALCTAVRDPSYQLSFRRFPAISRPL